MKEVAPLRYGVVFKKAFCDPEIFSAFIRDVLGIAFETDKVETEKEFHPRIGYVTTRFDLFAEDKKNRIVVDIQHDREPDHYDRFLYYHCVAMLEKIRSFDDYRPHLSVFTIVVLTSGDKHKRDVATIDFDPKDRYGRPLGEMSHKVVYLCPKYVNPDTPAQYREWLEAINDSLDEQVEETKYTRPLVRKVFDYIGKELISPDERARIIEENQQQRRFHAGGAAAKLKMAQNMRDEGLDESLILRVTGLTEEELQSLPYLEHIEYMEED